VQGGARGRGLALLYAHKCTQNGRWDGHNPREGAKSDVRGGVRGRRLDLSHGVCMDTLTSGGTHLYWALGSIAILTNSAHLDFAARARCLVYSAFVFTKQRRMVNYALVRS
jgi:hypothetical protein